jgi:hypothetical protein
MQRGKNWIPACAGMTELRIHSGEPPPQIAICPLPVSDLEFPIGPWLRSRGNVMPYFDEYLHFYKRFLFDAWNDMGPHEYVSCLLVVGLVGWYMMRKAGSMT